MGENKRGDLPFNIFCCLVFCSTFVAKGTAAQCAKDHGNCSIGSKAVRSKAFLTSMSCLR